MPTPPDESPSTPPPSPASCPDLTYEPLQPWVCHLCARGGSVPVPFGATSDQLRDLVAADHKRISPDCAFVCSDQYVRLQPSPS